MAAVEQGQVASQEAKTNGQGLKRAGNLAMIPISLIRENEAALRPAQRETEEYQCLAASVKQDGILQPLLVKEFPDPEDKSRMLYGLCDGLQRYNAALDAGIKEVPVMIKDMGQAEIEEKQIILNANKIETRAVYYTKQLERLMMRNPLMTVRQLADKLSRPEQWLMERFGLLKLSEDIQELVDSGKIALGNATQLAKIPKEEQENWIDRAQTQTVEEFAPAVTARLKELREAKKQGRAPKPETFSPTAHQRSWGEIKQAWELDAGETLAKDMIQRYNAKTPVEAFKLAIAWVAHMDQASKDEALAKNEARIKADAEKKEQRKQEREQKKRDAALEKEPKGEWKEGDSPQPVPAKA